MTAKFQLNSLESALQKVIYNTLYFAHMHLNTGTNIFALAQDFEHITPLFASLHWFPLPCHLKQNLFIFISKLLIAHPFSTYDLSLIPEKSSSTCDISLHLSIVKLSKKQFCVFLMLHISLLCEHLWSNLGYCLSDPFFAGTLFAVIPTKILSEVRPPRCWCHCLTY